MDRPVCRCLSACIEADQRPDSRRLGEDLTSDQFQVVRLVNGTDHCTSSYLAEALAVGKSSVTAIVNRLVDAGIIDRTRDEADRRLVYLTLTEYGHTIFESAQEQMREIVSPYLDILKKRYRNVYLDVRETRAIDV